ncbi:MAG: hypothetical protein ACJAUJ_001108 [Salibacteraceae bacterium]|jgi:hypothetical protein
MRDFLSKNGLYQIVDLSQREETAKQDFSSAFKISGQTFDYHCQHEELTKTFELELEPAYNQQWGKMSADVIPDEWTIDGKLNYTFHALGRCKSCNQIQVQFLLHVFQEEFLHEHSKKFFMQKVGVEPRRVNTPDPMISKYFNRESNNWYYKGINCLSENYGIGAMAYFRRIIEKELINIIEDIKTLPDAHTLEIQSLLDEHKANPTVSTIYDNIFEHLPHSLKSIGDNPIKLLYKQTSQALHSLTEKESLEKAGSILKLLNFVVIKINEERSEIKSIKDTLKNLK